MKLRFSYEMKAIMGMTKKYSMYDFEIFETRIEFWYKHKNIETSKKCTKFRTRF